MNIERAKRQASIGRNKEMSMKDINRSTCFLAILFSLNGQTEQTDPGNLHRRDAANPRGILFSSLSLSLSLRLFGTFETSRGNAIFHDKS